MCQVDKASKIVFLSITNKSILLFAKYIQCYKYSAQIKIKIVYLYFI